MAYCEISKFKLVNSVPVELSEEEFIEMSLESEREYLIDQKNAWFRYRVYEYPSIGDQLDMIWHSMDREEIPGKGIAWYEAIKAVKEKYPSLSTSTRT